VGKIQVSDNQTLNLAFSSKDLRMSAQKGEVKSASELYSNLETNDNYFTIRVAEEILGDLLLEIQSRVKDQTVI
jgi:hypothetical protein